MKKRLMSLLLVMLLLVTPVLAQESPPDPQTEEEAMARIMEALTAAEMAAAEAGEAVDRAFDLLGLFEAIGFFVTVAAGVAGVFGISQLGSARRELTESRRRVEQEVDEIRARFESELAKREADLEALQRDLEAAAHRDRETTAHALLANALMPLGERQYRAQDYEGALNTYQRALELDPENPVVHQRLGYVYTHSGELDKARDHYEKAISREENFAPALAGLGLVFRRLADDIPEGVDRDLCLNKAEEYLLQAMKVSPRLVDDDGESWWGVLGGLFRRRGQIDQAIDAYKRATVVTPESSYGFGNLALLYMKKGERDKMLETYERVESIAAREAAAEQGNFWGYADLIVARYALGKSDEAAEVLPIAISIAPVDSPYMLDGLAATLEELVEVVSEHKRSSIEEAIVMIRTEQERRESIPGEMSS